MNVKAKFVRYVDINDERYPICEFKIKGHKKQIISAIPDNRTNCTQDTSVVVSFDRNHIKQYIITNGPTTKAAILVTSVIIIIIISLFILTKLYGINMYTRTDSTETEQKTHIERTIDHAEF